VEEKAARDYTSRDSMHVLFTVGQKLENWKLTEGNDSFTVSHGRAVYAQAGMKNHLQAIFWYLEDKIEKWLVTCQLARIHEDFQLSDNEIMPGKQLKL